MKWLLNWLEEIIRDEIKQFKNKFFCSRCGTRTSTSNYGCRFCGHPIGKKKELNNLIESI